MPAGNVTQGLAAMLPFVTSASVAGSFAAPSIVSGAVKCWGANERLQLGAAIPESYSAYPVDVLVGPGASLKGAKELYAGWNNTCAVLDSGKVVCWGDNTWGQIGDGASPAEVRVYANEVPASWDPVEKQEVPLTGVKSLATDHKLTCAVLADDNLKCWGTDAVFGTKEAYPKEARGVPKATLVDVGGAHSSSGREGSSVLRVRTLERRSCTAPATPTRHRRRRRRVGPVSRLS